MRGGPRSFPQGSSCPVVLWILPRCLGLRLRGFHPLRPVFPVPFRCPLQSLVQSEPRRARTAVWALPRSLAATCGIDVSFFSSGYLDVSVRRVPLRTLLRDYSLCSCTDAWSLSMRVSPFRNPWINGYLLLPTAFRSLSRLSSAPSAKASAPCPFLLGLSPFLPHSVAAARSFFLTCCFFYCIVCFFLFVCFFWIFGIRFSRYVRSITCMLLLGLSGPFLLDERFHMVRLKGCYSPMGLSGLEPPTSRLSGVRSNRLSYKPRLL